MCRALALRKNHTRLEAKAGPPLPHADLEGLGGGPHFGILLKTWPAFACQGHVFTEEIPQLPQNFSDEDSAHEGCKCDWHPGRESALASLVM